MFSQKNILVIGRHADMLQNVLQLLQANNYQANGAITNQDAFHLFSVENFDAIIIGGGVDVESRTLFHSEFVRLKPSIKVIDAHPQTVLRDLQKALQ